MTIDERLERLAERHETLTQTVEIIAAMQKANEARIEDLSKSIESLTGRVNDLTESVAKLHSATERLAYVAELHERRLDRSEVTIEAILEDLRRRRQ